MKTKRNTTCVITIILGLLLTTITGSAIAESASNIEIINLSSTSINFSQEDLQAMPTTTVYAELYCEGSLAISGNWTGILLRDLLFKAQLTPEVTSIQFTASDGYKIAIPIELAMEPETIVAYHKDGQPLIEETRLILEEWNGAAWISLITTISMSNSFADYPLGVNIGTGKIKDLISAQPSQSVPSPTITALPSQPSATPTNTLSVQVSSPTNISSSNQTISKPQFSNNVGISFDVLTIGAVAFVLLMVVSVVALTYKRKRKLQNTI